MKIANAISISLEAIAQTMTGTSRYHAAERDNVRQHWLSNTQLGSREATELSIPNIITRWAASSWCLHRLGDRLQPDGDRVRDLRHCRGQRRRRRFLAKRFNMTSELGALLDPLADKALLVSIYVALGIWGAVPRWIVILVVSRDIMIVAAVIVSWLFDKPVPMKP